MRRTERVQKAGAADSNARRTRTTHAKKPTWVPRARRIKLDAQLRYRVKNLGTWYEGIVENLSQSGVLFNGPHALPANTLIDAAGHNNSENIEVHCSTFFFVERQSEPARPAKVTIWKAA